LQLIRKGWSENLGASASLSEAEVHWRDFFKHLQSRGLRFPFGTLAALSISFEPKCSKLCPQALDEAGDSGGDEGLTVFQFPKGHWKKLRTSNGIERVNPISRIVSEYGISSSPGDRRDDRNSRGMGHGKAVFRYDSALGV
jgi:transposase-like protein